MIRAEMPIRPGEVERHYPVSEVARLLGMSQDWVYDRLKDGTFVTANFGEGKSKRRIPASSINAFIEAHTYGTRKPAAVTAGQNINN
ncbi:MULTISPECIES: helix-turn-helix domain-containing protein [unclassified Leucobacter]|uniref:helix-turn-helix domain-containing protein n=1 Tax=unclassified Leucobacter TaxID=2621730 RepID=UPI00301983D5